MYFDKIKEHFQDEVTIYGANMGTEKGLKFAMLSEAKHEVEYTDEELEIVKGFEKKILELYERAENGSLDETTVNPPQIEDGKLVVKVGLVSHCCAGNMETLRNMAVGGILASEWFGKRESELEGFMCAFASKFVVHSHPMLDRWEKDRVHPGRRGGCVILFDESNPLMQALINNDFFEYEYIKRTTPEKLPELYSPEIIKFFDMIVEPMSPAGKKMHDRDRPRQSSGWLAIPGGIPPQLINGIGIGAESELYEHVDEIREMFPNAIIYNENLEVIALSWNEEHNDKFAK